MPEWLDGEIRLRLRPFGCAVLLFLAVALFNHALARAEAPAESDAAFLEKFVRESVRFNVSTLPVARPGATAAELAVEIENPGADHPAARELSLEVLFTQDRPELARKEIVKLPRLARVQLQFEIQLTDLSRAQVSLGMPDKPLRSVAFTALNWRRPDWPVLRASPHGEWIRNLEGDAVILFQGPEAKPLASAQPQTPKAVAAHRALTIASLVSLTVWDDYFLPRTSLDSFPYRLAEELGRDRLRAEVVDGGFSGLAVHALAEGIDPLLRRDPDLLLLSLGGHEDYTEYHSGLFENALEAIVDRVQSLSSARIVLISQPPSLRDASISQSALEAAGKVSEKKKLDFFDAGEIFTHAKLPLVQLYDRMSPNAQAHRFVAGALHAHLRKSVRRPTPKAPEEARPESRPQDPAASVLLDGYVPAINSELWISEWAGVSGRRAHRHSSSRQQSMHGFQDAFPLFVSPESEIVQEVFLSAEDTPQAVMLAFTSVARSTPAQGIDHFESADGNHRAFWGEALITLGKDQKDRGYHRAGTLPPAGAWVELAVKAKDLGLENRYLTAMVFVTSDGLAHWGRTRLRSGSMEQAWVDGAFPIGGESLEWAWKENLGGAPTRAHYNLKTQVSSSYGFDFRSPTPLPAAFVLRQDVYVDPDLCPEEIALHVGGARHYWGRLRAEDWTAWGQPAWPSFYQGPLPRAGNWAGLEIPLAQPGAGQAEKEKLGSSRIYPFQGNAFRNIRFEARNGRAYWGRTAMASPPTATPPSQPWQTAAAAPYAPPDLPPAAWLFTNRTGNVLFDGQKIPLRLGIANPSPRGQEFKARVRLLDMHGEGVELFPEARLLVPGRGAAYAEFPWHDAGRGFFSAVAEIRGQGHTLACSTTLARLSSDVNMFEKPIFMYENSGYFRDIFRLMDLTGTGRCRHMSIEQEIFRIRYYDDTPCRGREPGTEPLLRDYKDAREMAARKKSTPFKPQFWFTISSDEQNLNWHNLERWSETIRCTALGLKAGDPHCFVSTPEINSIAMGFIDKLGENHTFDYLDLYDTYGCSLPVPPEWTNKYWILDTGALAIMNEKFGHRLTQTGLQYSTGNSGRPWGIPEEHQAVYYVRGDILRRADHVDLISYFKFRESPNVNIFEIKDAILHYDLTPKPAYVAICTAFAMLDRSRYLGRFQAGQGNHLHLFEIVPTGSLLLVAWTTEPTPQKILLDCHSSLVRVTTMLGAAQDQKTARGAASFWLTGEPIYIEGVSHAVTQESSFQPAPVLPPFERRDRPLKPVFLAIENHRKAEDGYGDMGRGRGDFVRIAGDSFSLKVNVYNFSDKPQEGAARLLLPPSLQAKPESLPFNLEPVSATTLTFNVEIPFDTPPGLGKIVASGTAAGGANLDDFTSDILILSPLKILPLEAPPEAGTIVRVRITNPTWRPIDAVIRLSPPPGWRFEPADLAVSGLAPGQAEVAKFTIAESRPVPFHHYPMTATAQIGGVTAAFSDTLDFATIHATGDPPVLDGLLDDWANAGPLDYGQKANNYIYLQLREMFDRTNFGAVIRTMFDAQNLYLSLDVTDDHICNEDTKHGILWDMDAWQIQLDINGDEAADGQINVAPTGRSYFHPSDPRGDLPPMLTGGKGIVEVASRVYREAEAARPRGYSIELAIPWRFFQVADFTPGPQKQIGLSFFCVDEDFRAWSARPWDFQVGQKGFGWLVFSQPQKSFRSATNRARRARVTALTKMPGDFVRAESGGDSGLIFGQSLAGPTERFPTTGLDLPEKQKAGRLWFCGSGFVEYEYDLSAIRDLETCSAIEFQAELSSCYSPGNSHYALPGNPSEIMLELNGTVVGAYLCPGDPGADGWLVTWRVDPSGCFVNGNRVALAPSLEAFRKPGGKMTARLSVKRSAHFRGGLKLYGVDSTGMHNTDMALRFIWNP